MRHILLASVAALGLAAVPAWAQGGSTQSPPSPNGGNSAPQSGNSLPSGAATMNLNKPTSGGGMSAGSPTQSGQPAYPSGSTNNQPSGAMNRTVPAPASR